MSQGDYTELLAEVDEALGPQTFRHEMRELIHAPKGSQAAKARVTLGWMLVIIGLVGVPLLFLAFLLGAAVIGAIVDAIAVLL